MSRLDAAGCRRVPVKGPARRPADRLAGAGRDGSEATFLVIRMAHARASQGGREKKSPPPSFKCGGCSVGILGYKFS